MSTLFARLCLVYLAGSTIASIVIGNYWPLVVASVALVILRFVYRKIEEQGGRPNEGSGQDSATRSRRRRRRR